MDSKATDFVFYGLAVVVALSIGNSLVWLAVLLGKLGSARMR